MIRWLKRLFGIYESGYEYWVDIDDIRIPPEFAAKRIRFQKLKRKRNYYYRTGEFESPILLKKNWTLVDGYSSYIIAKKIMHLDKVPVFFVNA